MSHYYLANLNYNTSFHIYHNTYICSCVVLSIFFSKVCTYKSYFFTPSWRETSGHRIRIATILCIFQSKSAHWHRVMHRHQQWALKDGVVPHYYWSEVQEIPPGINKAPPTECTPGQSGTCRIGADGIVEDVGYSSTAYNHCRIETPYKARYTNSIYLRKTWCPDIWCKSYFRKGPVWRRRGVCMAFPQRINRRSYVLYGIFMQNLMMTSEFCTSTLEYVSTSLVISPNTRWRIHVDL